MSSCTVFVFLSLMEYALVNIILGDLLEEVESQMVVKHMIKKMVSYCGFRLNKSGGTSGLSAYK